MLIIVMLSVIITIVLFVVILLSKPECPECGGKMDDVDSHDGITVYKCRDCGEEWI